MLLKTPIAAGTCFAAGAGAASAARYPKRVQDLLNYVRDHPAPMTGIPMEYEARPAAPVPSVRSSEQAPCVAHGITGC